MKSIYTQIIEQNIPYTIQKVANRKWYVVTEDGMANGDAFETKTAAIGFMARVKETVEARREVK